MATSQLPKMIGATVKRKEDPRLMSGEGKFTDDVQLRGMVYMAVLRSPHAHARIRRLGRRLSGDSLALSQQSFQSCHSEEPFGVAQAKLRAEESGVGLGSRANQTKPPQIPRCAL